MSELKACPFCGGKGTYYYQPDLERPELKHCHNVCCDRCAATTGIYISKEQAVATWNRRTQPTNEPLTLHFGRGELGVGTAYKAPDAPPREINIRRLYAPLPIASPTGDKGKYVDELENVLVRMQFDNAESAHVLERAVRTVLDGFEPPPNEPLTIDELCGMDGEPVWVTHKDGSGGRWGIVNSYKGTGMCADLDSYTAYWFDDWCGTIAYRRKPKEDLQC